MKLLLCVVAFISTAIGFRYADAAEKVKKPTVCMHYAIAKTGKADDDAVGICYDGKKPALFYRFEEVNIVDGGTGRIKVMVGWR